MKENNILVNGLDIDTVKLEKKKPLKKEYKYNRNWRKKNTDKFRRQHTIDNHTYNHRYRDRFKFSRKVYYQVRKGYLTKKPCRICGSTNHLQATTLSKDYHNPVWLCDSCNKRLHKKIKNKEVQHD